MHVCVCVCQLARHVSIPYLFTHLLACMDAFHAQLPCQSFIYAVHASVHSYFSATYIHMQCTSCTFCSCRFANSTDLFATDNFAEEVWSAQCNMLQAQNHSPSYNFYIVNAGFLDVCCD